MESKSLLGFFSNSTRCCSFRIDSLSLQILAWVRNVGSAWAHSILMLSIPEQRWDRGQVSSKPQDGPKVTITCLQWNTGHNVLLWQKFQVSLKEKSTVLNCRDGRSTKTRKRSDFGAFLLLLLLVVGFLLLFLFKISLRNMTKLISSPKKKIQLGAKLSPSSFWWRPLQFVRQEQNSKYYEHETWIPFMYTVKLHRGHICRT